MWIYHPSIHPVDYHPVGSLQCSPPSYATISQSCQLHDSDQVVWGDGGEHSQDHVAVLIFSTARWRSPGVACEGFLTASITVLAMRMPTWTFLEPARPHVLVWTSRSVVVVNPKWRDRLYLE